MQTESLQKTKAHNTEGKCRNQRVLCNTDRHGGKKVHKNSRPFKKHSVFTVFNCYHSGFVKFPILRI